MSSYTPSMERIERPVTPTDDVTFDIEKEIIPIGQLGTTFIDQGNVLQNLENSIRLGTKKVQLILSGGGGNNPSSFASSFGKDVRRALYEKAKATGVEITGVEMSPQMMQGLSGNDPRGGGRISEETRQHNLNAVRDAIRFVADVAKGGGIDIYSQEFNRDILDASWNKDKDGKKIFFDYSQDELDEKNKEARRAIVKYLVDKRTGDPIRDSIIRKDEPTTVVKFATAKDLGLAGKKDANGNILGENDYVDVFHNKLNEGDADFAFKRMPLVGKDGRFEVKEMDWKQIDEERKRYNEANKRKLAEEGFENGLSAEEFLYRQKLEANQALVRGQGYYYAQDLEARRTKLRELDKLRQSAVDIEKSMGKEEQARWTRNILLPSLTGGKELPEDINLQGKKPSELVTEVINREQHAMLGHQEQVVSYRLQEEELEKMKRNIVTPDKFAMRKVTDSYSEMGIEAMNITKERKLPKPVYIGPEIGMASEMYGGHPKEFVDLIKNSRNEMKVKLMARGMTEEAAADAAKTHIKGMMDTSHMMMWYKHFARKPGESDEKHIKRFNEWLVDQSRMLAREGVLGGVQVVDTITGDHAHLPVGQGSFDTVGMVRAMKEEGFKGDIISEGHAEDTMGMGQGRILTETWKAFGSPIGNYAPGRAGLRSWGGIQSSYFGHTNPTTYIAGAYVPSNDWQLWSETPFE